MSQCKLCNAKNENEADDFCSEDCATKFVGMDIDTPTISTGRSAKPRKPARDDPTDIY